MDPAGATGSVQFTVDSVNLGSPLPLVDGHVRSEPIAGLSEGSHTLGAEYIGDGTYSASSAETAYYHPGKAWAHVSLSYDQASGPQLVPLIATIDPPDATGSIVFRLNGAQVGAAVTLVEGRAESIPVDFPEPETSYSIGFEYSGDDSYRAIASQLIADWRPESPEELPAVPDSSAAAPTTASSRTSPAPTPGTTVPLPASPTGRILPRTGSEPLPVALLAVGLIGLGSLLVRAGRNDMYQIP